MLIGGFQPFTLCDFPGRTAAIVFSQGCNFRCPCCHNRQLWPRRPGTLTAVAEEGVLTFLTQRRGRLGGLVITGGEPTLQPDLADFVREVKRLRIAVKLDTNGSRPEVIAALLSEALLDYIAMDVKAPMASYDRLCGVTVDPSAIGQTIGIIAASRIPHHFRTTFDRARLSEADLASIQAMLPPHADYRIQACREVH